MKLQEFDYILPQELIAQYPLQKRDQARLMVVERSTGRIHHSVLSGVEQYLPTRSIIVLNDSRVIPARLWGRRETGGRVEIFLLNRLADGYSYEALIRPLKRLKAGEKIIFTGNGLSAQLQDPQRKIIRFNHKNVGRSLKTIGHVPLPPYIKRADTPLDQEYYQTVYAQSEGSVAAPTAGLHFTRPLLEKLEGSGHKIVQVTLHINYATFKTVQEEDITRHRMHEESYAVSRRTKETLENAQRHGQKIIAVGTTSCRVLETLATGASALQGTTDIFIYPGYQFQMTDCLLTNFHLPRSTLLMFVYAFGGVELIKKAYAEAIARRYRFYSYGDCMMIV